MNNNYNLEVKKILKEAENEMFELNHPYVGSEHMLLGILKISTDLKELLASYDLTYEKFKRELITIVGSSHKKSELALYTPLLKRIIADATEEAAENNNGTVIPEHLLLGMLEEGEGVGIRILLNMDINIEGIYNDLVKNSSNKKGKSSILLEIGKQMMPDRKEKIYKREKEIENLIEILLRKNKNNPLLLGEAGVGKTAIVEELARRIEDGDIPDTLANHKIIELDTGSLISGTRYRGEFEDRLNKIIKEAVSDKNVILFIDEIHTLVNCGGAEGAIDAANILKPYLARGSLKVIGATTLKEYKMTIYKDKALDRRFQIINVEEPSIEDTEYILKNIKNNYEDHHHVSITEKDIKCILKYANKYIHNRYNPDKSIDILDSVCAHAQLNKPNNKQTLIDLMNKKNEYLNDKKYKNALEVELEIKKLKENEIKVAITEEDIIKVVEKRANIPILEKFKEKLESLPSILKETVVGQNEQIEEICQTLKEKYLFELNKPLSIWIEGTVGTGKTMLAKEIARNLFGERNFLRLDMSELSGEGSINKLLGTTQGYVGYEDECLLGTIKDYPYSIILLDGIEKASPKVLNLFKEIVENGKIRNGKGEEMHFENSTVIFTTTINNSANIGFNRVAKKDKPEDSNPLKKIADKTITLSNIDLDTAKKYLMTQKEIELSLKEADTILKNVDLQTSGMRGLIKAINRYKIDKMLAKV
ncbi:MAG: ATP-dependent Clp protease ATP-binding subunit [Bacilli bacterium]|nr:ATP-dependent Clp protease ATP-binding subunit [Bacilli bacterium]